MVKKSEDFNERKELIDLKNKSNREKHKMKMEELKFIRETNEKIHQNEMERQRIKSAEIRKNHERREMRDIYKKR